MFVEEDGCWVEGGEVGTGEQGRGAEHTARLSLDDLLERGGVGCFVRIGRAEQCAAQIVNISFS